MQDVKSSIALKDAGAEHLEKGMVAWTQLLLQKTGWRQLASQAFSMPDLRQGNNAKGTFCYLQSQIQLRNPSFVLLHLEAGELCIS